MDAERRRLRPLANAARLTAAAGVRPGANRLHTSDGRRDDRPAADDLCRLVLAAARPTGMPTSATAIRCGSNPRTSWCASARRSPIDAAGAVLRYFAEQVDRLRHPTHRADLAEPAGGTADPGLPVRQGTIRSYARPAANKGTASAYARQVLLRLRRERRGPARHCASPVSRTSIRRRRNGVR